jgi:hypothetical protein
MTKPGMARPQMTGSKMNRELKLLVEWSSPWEEFVTAIRPALSRSPEPLDGEAPTGLFPYRGMLLSLTVEIALLVVMIVLPEKLARMRPVQPKAPPQYDVIYFSGDELPRTEDAGGAKTGRSGRSGGREGHHATQVIRVARGPSLKEQVVDAPKLDLPPSDSSVANLFAYKSVPGPPPAKGFESSLRHAEMPLTAVPPPSEIQNEQPHAAPILEASVIAPSPSALQRELTSRRTPGSKVDVAPPPVSAPREITNLHPLLTLPASAIVPPAPPEREFGSVNTRLGTQELRKQIVRPPEEAGNVVSDRKPVNNLGNSAVVAPPSQLGNISAARRQPGSLGEAKIVPPSAQLNGSVIHSPANGLGDSKIVPPPAQLNAPLTHQQASGLGDSKVVPPPAQLSGSVTHQQKTDGLGNGRVIPPPAQLNGSLTHQQGNGLGDNKVVPPPAQLSGSLTHQQASGLGNGRVVPPPAQLNGSLMHQQGNGLGDNKVVPPPAQLNAALTHQQANGLSAGTAVVPPPPSASGNSASGAGRGRRGPADAMADAVAPPSHAAEAGIVLSNKPGEKVGVPGTASPGSLAMSPAGEAKAGLGGTGGGTGISHGSGPGSSTSGQGPGAKTSGAGPGSDEIAHKGISPFPGTGGAGKGSTAPPTMAGVSVSGGGNNIVLPSFGSDRKPPDDPAHSSVNQNQQGPGITVVATSHSGGAFNFYGALKGDKVYTIYIDTALGTAVMQFADPKSAAQSYPEDLTAPLALRADLPSDLHSSRLVIECTLDRSGVVRSPRVVEGESELSAEILAALPHWKFRPAFRGDQPIEVNAILGFDIDTR